MNTAQPGGHIDAVVYDAHGNVTMQVTADNRRWALDTEPADTAAHEAELVRDVVSSQRIYTADGKRLTAEIGPSHEMRLASGTLVNGRVRTEYTFDEGAPGIGGPFNLVTTETTSARWFDGGQERQADARATKHEYDWELRQRTKTTVDPAGLALVSRTGYDTEGRIITETTPGGGGSENTPSTSVTVYYTAAAQTANPQCGNRPDWDGLVCLTMSGGQPASGAELPATAYTYNMFGQPLTTSETTSSATLRTTTLTYDQAGRTIEVKVIAPGLGEPVATRRTVYDEATGHNVKTQVIDGAGAVTAEIVREFDALGQSTSYRDADGNTSTSTYVLLGRPLTSNDGKATRSYSYDEGNERRGLPSSVVDSNVGKFTGTYDADGRLTSQRWPNGVTVDLTLNSTGTATGLIYAQPGCGQTDCTLYQETIKPGPQGQWESRTSTLSSQDYGHDQAGRLTQVADTADGQCVTRSYTYDAAFNRTGQTSYAPGTDGTCQTTTASTTTGWTFDTASRAVNTGYSYDALGRTLTMPGADTATGGGNVTVGYHGNDMVRSITQGSHTTVYTLDAVDSRIRSWTDNKTGTVVGKTNHYTDDSDSPTWTDEGDGKFTRPIAGLGGIAAQHTATVGEVWTLTNMHGDFVAAMGEIGAGLAATSEYTENGQPRNSADAGKRYGWHGADQRAADTPGGLLLMGVRLYTPTTGRFLQVDPVINGSCNPYEYACGDPVNNSDLTGEYADGGGGGGNKPDCVLLKCSTWTWWAKAISIVTNVLGFAPGWMCPACAVISLALGAIAGILYWLGGNKKEAFRTWAWALAGFVMGKFAEKALPKIFRHYGKQIKHTVRATMMRAKRVVPSKLYKKADNIVAGVLGLFGLILDAIGG